MENLTLGQIGLAVAFMAALIGGVSTLLKQIRGWIAAEFTANIAPLKREVEGLGKRLDEVDMHGTKNFLVKCITDVERGQTMGEIETERFWEEYEHYRKGGGNSYIAQKVEKLKAEGKL